MLLVKKKNMSSLHYPWQKLKKVEDLAKWAENRPIWLSWKLDGLTLVVTYDNGKLTKVVTTWKWSYWHQYYSSFYGY